MLRGSSVMILPRLSILCAAKAWRCMDNAEIDHQMALA